MEKIKDMKESVGGAFGSCLGRIEALPTPPSWEEVKASVEKIQWPAWGEMRDNVKNYPADHNWNLPRPNLNNIKAPTVTGFRSSFSDLRENFNGRVTSCRDHFSGVSEWPEVVCGHKPDREEARSRSRSPRSRKRANMRRNDWYSSCWCFKGSEPPQIDVVISDQPQMVQMAYPADMADGIANMAPEEMQSKVTELLDELDLTSTQKNGILNFPPQKQLQLLYDYTTLQSSSKKTERPEAYIAKIDEYSEMRVPADEFQHTSWLKYTEGLKTALATQSNTFVNEFMDAGGLATLLSFLVKMEDDVFQSSIHTHVIASIKALMNNSNGRKHILAHPTCMNTISQSLRTENLKTKTMVLEILGGVCLLPGGHKKVLEAMLHFQKHQGERTRFQTLIVDLDRSWGPRQYVDELSLKLAIMSFINAIIRWGPGEDSLEFRLHLRYEFLMLGVQPVIEKLRALQNDILDKHLDAFEYYRAEDEREWARRFEEVHVDTKSASSMFKLLQSKLQYSAAYPHFLSLMHHLLLLPNDIGSPDPWILFDRVLQQLVTQAEDGQDREVKLLDINVNTIVKLIANERELTESRAKIMKLESEFADVVTDLNRKEQELYSYQQEKDELSRTLQQVRGQMEMEHNNSVEAQQRNVELDSRILVLTTQIQQLAAGSLSDDVKATLANTPVIQESISKSAPPPPPPPMMNGGPPPPPPPMMNGPPPPPPPGGKGPPPPPSGKVNKPTKQIPKSATTLRAFNWNKMPESRVNGTIFATLDESSLYKFMDLEDIDRAFDASSGKKSTIESTRLSLAANLRATPSFNASKGERTIERLSRQRTQQITVIEGRRQQNCTILLSKLKMTNEELIRVLLKMDSDCEIAPDMVEQLLKFTPTAEEKSMLEEHVDELDQLARADRFLYDISKIDHYEERLQCLLYQKKFRERLAECEPRTLAVIHASKELQNSKRLKKLMEVVLAFGNYMNKGARGGAYGFRISSLNKLTDTKSSNNRQITLLHYIIGVCEKQWKEVLKLEDDFPHVKEASKVSITELEKEISQLRQGLDYIEKEVNWHRGQGATPPGDRFRLVMNEFTALAKDKFTHNECQFKNMKAQFERVVQLYGEDHKSAQPEDFFGTFDIFCDSFKDAKKDLENMRKKEEEEERKRKEAERREAERERRARERKASMANMNGINGQTSGDSSSGGENENDFDDLISALRSGDVFGKDIDKMRRKKKHSFSGASRERERIVGSHKYA